MSEDTHFFVKEITRDAITLSLFCQAKTPMIKYNKPPPSMFWLKAHWLKIVYFLFLAGLAILTGFFLYQYYLKPNYALAELLPDDYQISLELSLDRFSLPSFDQQKLLKNESLKNIYETIGQAMDGGLSQLPPASAKTVKSANRIIIFASSPENYAIALKIPAAKGLKKIQALDFKPYYSTIIKKQILLIASNQNYLKQIENKKISASANPYFSLTFNPWLKVNINKSFFAADYQNSIAADLQQALWPLSLSESNGYGVSLDISGKNLIANLMPDKPSDNASDGLNNYLNLIDGRAKLVLGFANPAELLASLPENSGLTNWWQKADGRLFLNQQISLTQTAKNIAKPIIAAFGQDFWQIISDQSQTETAKSALTGYLAQSYAKEKTKILPDGTKAIELVSDPSKVSWISGQNNGWTIIYQEKIPKLGWAVKNSHLMVSNSINSISAKGFSLNCPIKTQDNQISGIFFLNNDYLGLKLGNFPSNFKSFTGISYSNGEINLCFGLK